MATILDLAKMQYADPVVGLIEESLAAAPEVAALPARTVPGTSFRTFVRTALPTVSFTKANAGVAASSSTFEQRLTELYPLRGIIQIDKALSAQSDGLGLPNLEMMEAAGVVQSILRKLGKQVWYGTSTNGDSSGFPGIKDALPKSDTAHVIDAGGTTASTASSVYLIKRGLQDASLVTGNNTTLALSPFSDQQVQDSSSNWYDARVANVTAWAGMQLGNANCIVRICNLTADSGKGLTDSLLAQALALFQIGYQPDSIWMSRRSRRQLQQQRTVQLYSQAGISPGAKQGTVAEVPMEFNGLPIFTTDQILNTDAIE